MMKKIAAFALAMMLLFAFAGCAAESAKEEAAPEQASSSEANEIVKLIEEGYSATMSGTEENKWMGLFQKEDSLEHVYKATGKMTDELCEQWNAIDIFAEDADRQQMNVLSAITDLTVEDIADRIPSEDDLAAYAGKTFGDLEAEGYENTGWSGEADDIDFFYDGPEYCLLVWPEEGTVIENMDDYSVNDIRALVIGRVEFAGFAYGVLEND